MELKKKYYSVKEVSLYTSIAPSTLYQWAAEGQIPSIKIGKKVLFDILEIDQFLDSLKRSSNLIDKKSNEVVNG